MSHEQPPRFHPPWWPPDEPWPPAGPPGMHAWHKMRGRFFRRMAVVFALLFIFAAGGCLPFFWFAGRGLGWIDIPRGGPPPFARGEGIVALFLLGAAGVFIAGRALRRAASPIDDLTEAAGRVAGGDYSARVAERGPHEVRAVAQAFNSMAARLQTDAEQRRNLMADVTHELRTPLTVIQGNLEGLLDGVYPRDEAHLTPILEETRVLSRLVDDLRTLALAETGALKLRRELTDISPLVSETIASFRASADAAGVELRVEVPADLPLLDIDPARMREVLANLIANALRYTPAGGKITVECSLNEAGRRLTISVRDTGTGIPPGDLPQIFDRFYKSPDSRGTGLGLAIARDLVTAHGGEIFARSEIGQGTTIWFTLPAS